MRIYKLTFFLKPNQSPGVKSQTQERMYINIYTQYYIFYTQC